MKAPVGALLAAALITILYLLAPNKAVRRVNMVLRPPTRTLVDAVGGCDASGECTVEALVRRHAVDNTVVVTLSNWGQSHFTENWIFHLRHLLGVEGILVGMMNLQPQQSKYKKIARKLRALGAGVYTVNSPEVKRQPQGGRWFHILPLLRTGARVLLSDSDVVWIRDPRPYLARLEAEHPALDFTVSSDAQGGSDGRRLGAAPTRGGGGGGRGRRGRRAARRGGVRNAGIGDGGGVDDLDVEAFGHCWTSMNIGIMHFPPGKRPGTLAAMEQAVAHLASENNLGRVDQGPINFRWKHGAGGGKAAWRWDRQLFGYRDTSGKRLCGLVNGTSIAGVLPSAQFCNTLTHSVLQLWNASAPPVQPFALHATWMRQQREEYKRMRMREEGYWRDAPSWYGLPPASGEAAVMRLSTNGKANLARTNGFVVYTPRLRAEWLRVVAMREKGGIPINHMVLMHEQIRQMRNALFIARALNRALVLPYTRCSCEMGFFPYHVHEGCRAPDHPTLPLPYNCAIDHYLDPVILEGSPYAHRERSFLTNPRTPQSVLASTVRVTVQGVEEEAGGGRGGAVVSLPRSPTIATLRERLSGHSAKILAFDDVLASFGGWGDAGSADANSELVRFHEDAQALFSSWCCTADERFKRLAGVIPYVLPPLEGQSHWRGHTRLAWAATALADVFAAANETQRASEIRPPA